MGVEQGFVRKSGAWYTYDGDQLGQGKENARAFLRDNPDLADEIEKKIKEKLGIGPGSTAGRRRGGVPAAPGARTGRLLILISAVDRAVGGRDVLPYDGTTQHTLACPQVPNHEVRCPEGDESL